MTTQTWNLDPSHSAITFTVRHMVVSKVRGSFNRWQGTLQYDPSRPEDSKVSVQIETASISTNEGKRDDHLRSADFFDAEKHPQITFQSKKVLAGGKERLKVIGDLTIHGITREVELETEFLGVGKDPWGAERVGFSATTTLNRKDFGLNWNQALEAGGVLVGEKVELALEVQGVKASAVSQAA